MKHLYIARSYGENETYKLLCTNKWEPPTNFGKTKYRGRRSTQLNFVTTRAQVTCPYCLDILIPKHEAELARMKASRGTAPLPPREEPMNEAFEPLSETQQPKEDFL